MIGLIRVELQEGRPDTILGRLVVYGDAPPGDSLGGPLRGYVRSAHLEDPAGTFAEVGPNPMGAGYFLGDPLIREQPPAWPHAIGNAVALVLATLNMMVHTRDAWTSVVPWGLSLSALVVLILLFTGWMGWSMVYRHRIGVVAHD